MATCTPALETQPHGFQKDGHLPGGRIIGEIMHYWVHSADTGAEWTRGLIDRVRGGAYTFAGEGDPFVGVLAEGEENPYATGQSHGGDAR